MITHYTFWRINKLKGVTFWYLQRLIPFHRPSLPQIWELWVSYGLEMMSLRHGWGWHPPQIASHIHIRYIQSVLAIGMLSQGHIGSPSLYHFTAQAGPIFGNSGSLEEWKWLHCIMFEADIHLRPLCTSVAMTATAGGTDNQKVVQVYFCLVLSENDTF